VTAGDRVDLTAYDAWLFDLDGVVTDTARVHAAAWKAAFDPVLAAEGVRTGTRQDPFDPVDDYLRFVDGRPRADGVRGFFASRWLELDEGSPGDPPGTGTVRGIAAGKNELVRQVLATDGVAVYPGTLALLELLRSHEVRTAVVSASENTGAVLVAAGIGDLFDARVDGLVARLQSKPVDADTLARVKNVLRGRVYRLLGSNQELAALLPEYYASYGNWRKLLTVAAEYQRLTAEELQRVAMQYLIPASRTAAYMTSPPQPGSAASNSGGLQ